MLLRRKASTADKQKAVEKHSLTTQYDAWSDFNVSPPRTSFSLFGYDVPPQSVFDKEWQQTHYSFGDGVEIIVVEGSCETGLTAALDELKKSMKVGTMCILGGSPCLTINAVANLPADVQHLHKSAHMQR